MKKTQEVLGLPIISISDGVEVGRVKSILINAEKGAIDYIVVDSGIQILSARVIPTGSVLGIGEYALTIENDSAINDIGKIPAAIDLLQKNIQVKGAKVLTKKGRLVGEIGDFYFDENESCKITGLEYIADITHKCVRIIPRECVITFGKNLIIVSDDVESTLIDRLTQLESGDKPSDSEKKNLVSFDLAKPETSPTRISSSTVEDIVVRADKVIADDGENYFRETQENVKEQQADIPENEAFNGNSNETEGNLPDKFPPFDKEEMGGDTEVLQQNRSNGQADEQNIFETKSNAQNLFEQRQRQYLNGRRATKTIFDSSGKVVVSDGDLIDDDIIEIVKKNGKLIELVMNNKA